MFVPSARTGPLHRYFMIYLHKILPIFVLPIGVTILLVVVGLLLKKRVLALFGVALLWLFSMPATGDFLMKAVSYGYARKPAAMMPRADAIVVLGGMLEMVEGAPYGEWNKAADRFDGGVELYRAGKAPLLIFTGGWIPWKPDHPPEGLLIAKRAELLGISKGAIRVTEKVQNTAEEAAAVSRMIPPKQGKRAAVLLVTSAYHMRRSRLLFERAGLNVIPYPVDFEVESGVPLSMMRLIPGAGALERSESALRETIGFAYYQIMTFL